ncbi:MAG: branched-chain amino acid ABC transporter permease [Thermoproteota archaeon]|nr:MAG: branched-chain amino acid ABC transporter permease [Candidatus Korarchaeota archaeon]
MLAPIHFLVDQMIPIELLIAQTINGLVYASILFLVSSGLTMIYGIMNILNLAHGSLYMLGAYFAITIIMKLAGGSPWGYLAAFILAPTAVMAVGAAIEVGLLKPIYGKPEEYQLLLTFGLILIFDEVVKLIWGPAYINFPNPGRFLGSIEVAGFEFPVYRLLLIALGFSVAWLLWFLLSKTTLGKKMRAAAADREIVSALGVSVPLLFTGAFMLGSFLSGLGGVAAGPLYTASPGMGIDIIVNSFAVIVIGGMGSILGALVGSLIVGLTRAYAIVIYPAIELALVYLIMVIVLLVRPVGLFGKPEEVRR